MRPVRRVARAAPLVLCCLSLCAVGAPAAYADAELTVSPLIMEVEATAGKSVTETITATASGSDSIALELVHADFGFGGPDYQVQLIRDNADETTAFSTRGWFSLPRKRYVIRAGESVDLPLTIDVPENTPGGTYLGAALLRVVPPDASGGGSQVQAVPETGPLLFIAVEGGDPPEAAMKRFDVPGLLAKGPLRPKLVIENIGDEFFSFEGTIELSGPGKDRTIEVDRQFVVPGEPRTIRTSANEKGKDGAPKLGTSKLEMGRYEVTTRLRIEPLGTTLVATRTVWVIPVWARVVGAALVLLFLVCVWFLARWLSHRRELGRLVREELAADAAASRLAPVAVEDDVDPDDADDSSWDDDVDDDPDAADDLDDASDDESSVDELIDGAPSDEDYR
ncbi:MAG: hypothetical protein JWL76_791 [Thermoleophilia bacterium]|nr:hypothetical protein [Thermoleophilia bacterium]